MENKKRIGFVPQNCGRGESDIDWETEIPTLSVELTEEEKKSRFAKYYYRGLTQPSAENLRQCEPGNPLPLSEAFMPEDYCRRMTPDKLDQMRSGYCVMENGIGFSLARVQMPGITEEVMEVFAREYHPEGDIFYKSWFPGAHMRHFEMMAVEDVGVGMETVKFMDFIPPARLGVGEGHPLMDARLISLKGLNGISWPLHTPYQNTRYVLETLFYRDIPGGREAFVHFWHGLSWDLENQKSIRRIPEGEAVNLSDVRAQANHAVWELTQSVSLISAVYRDFR